MDREDGDQLVIEVPGGSLGYAGFGDPDGVPCFAFHGNSSSRLMPGWMFPPELLTAAGVRMIGVDRPGYGLSRAPRAAGLADWPGAVGCGQPPRHATGEPLWVAVRGPERHGPGQAAQRAQQPAGAAVGQPPVQVIGPVTGAEPLPGPQRAHAAGDHDDRQTFS